MWGIRIIKRLNVKRQKVRSRHGMSVKLRWRVLCIVFVMVRSTVAGPAYPRVGLSTLSIERRKSAQQLISMIIRILREHVKGDFVAVDSYPVGIIDHRHSREGVVNIAAESVTHALIKIWPIRILLIFATVKGRGTVVRDIAHNPSSVRKLYAIHIPAELQIQLVRVNRLN